ncbi:MAG: winged-helix domain-containing protein [Pyrobaculum sp.]
MPSRTSKKVRTRTEEVAHLLLVRGCVLTRDAVAALGLTRSQVEYVLRQLASNGRAARIMLGQLSVWCYSGNSAAKFINKLRRALHTALCRANVKFVEPRKALKIALSDENASKLFTRYVSLDAVSSSFINSLLALTYGDPVYYKRTKPMYMVTCGEKLPPLRR